MESCRKISIMYLKKFLMEFLGVFPISQRFFCTYDDTKQLKNHEENYTNFYKKKSYAKLETWG